MYQHGSHAEHTFYLYEVCSRQRNSSWKRVKARKGRRAGRRKKGYETESPLPVTPLTDGVGAGAGGSAACGGSSCQHCCCPHWGKLRNHWNAWCGRRKNQGGKTLAIVEEFLKWKGQQQVEVQDLRQHDQHHPPPATTASLLFDRQWWQGEGGGAVSGDGLLLKDEDYVLSSDSEHEDGEEEAVPYHPREESSSCKRRRTRSITAAATTA